MSNAEMWENGQLGQDEEFVAVAKGSKQEVDKLFRSLVNSEVNTKVLQLQSVINFMHELAYEYLPVSGVFQSEAWVNRGRKEVSLRVAILLHNGHYNDNHGNPYFHQPFDDILSTWWVDAHKAKIVHIAKLQHGKRKGLIVQGHMVKFVNPENVQYFIKESEPLWKEAVSD
jgi:hypothetical protein